MAFPKKTPVSIAVDSHSRLDLSAPHLTTADFMQFNIAKCLELVPDQSVNVQHNMFTRLEPLAVPPMAECYVANRAYFVPYRTVWRCWDDFIFDVPHAYDDGTYSIPARVPTIDMRTMISYLAQPVNSDSVASSDAYDFIYVNVSAGGVVSDDKDYRKFNSRGRHAYKLLRQLGYPLTFAYNTSGVSNRVFSALPLLCAARIYCDYYFPEHYANTGDSIFLMSLFNSNATVDSLETRLNDITNFSKIMDLFLRVSYESDYFTSAWDNPVSPNNGLASTIEIRDISNDVGDVTPSNASSVNMVTNSQPNGTPLLRRINTNSATGALTTYILNALQSVSDYLKRHQLAGSRVIDRALARWGVELKSDKLSRCYKIAEYRQAVQFGDVTSTASTDGATLGDFAGKGVSFGTGNFEMSTTEYGMLIVTSLIFPEYHYYEGAPRYTSHISKLDFYTPEFDNLGTQAMALSELYVPRDGSELSGITNYYDRIFGFVPRYAEYKVPNAQMTGDLILNSMNVGKDSWNLFRSIKPYIDDVGLANLKHNLNFVLSGDAEQYDRIFATNNDNTDHFIVRHFFKISSNFPGKSLFDTYEFENEDESKKVALDNSVVRDA